MRLEFFFFFYNLQFLLQGLQFPFSRKEKILEELISTELNSVNDLQTVITGYRDKIASSNTKIASKATMIFGNMDEICDFHTQNLLPELESCGTRPELIAETFLENSQQLTRIYCR